MGTTQQQNLDELLKLCRWLVEAKKIKMADSALHYGIDLIAEVVKKFDEVPLAPTA